MLTSELLSPSEDLQAVADGTRTIPVGEESESVELLQQALVALGYSLPNEGIDGTFGPDMNGAVDAYRAALGLTSDDSSIDADFLSAVDADLTYLDGNLADLDGVEVRTLAMDPYIAGLWEHKGGDASVIDRLLDTFELNGRICFRLSFLVGGLATAPIGRLAEVPIFNDFCAQRGGFSPDYFMDSGSSTDYVDFLLSHNPASDPAKVRDLGGKRRPDIISHLAPQEWYEIKPASFSGMAAGIKKWNVIPGNYLECGLPYVAGKAYTPSPEIHLMNLIGDGGENLELFLNVERRVSGLLLWTLCIRGDYVRYFNRVRLVAGLLAIIVALAPEVLAGAEVAAVVEAIVNFAASLGIGSLPALSKALN
jgi:hypothetical protein